MTFWVYHIWHIHNTYCQAPGTSKGGETSVFLYCKFAVLCDTIHCFLIPYFFRYTIVLIYYAFCLVFMMLLRPLLVKKIACGLGKTDRFKSIYAALYFFPILTVLQAVGGGLLCECRFFISFLMNIWKCT